MQGEELLAVAGERALGAALLCAHALPRGARLDVQQHGHMAGQRVAHALGSDAAAPERDHRVRSGVVQQLAHQLLLRRAERRLAAQLELARHRMTEALGQQRVAVERPAAERPGELAGHGRLAGAHEADQDECHPIRSS